MVHMISFSVSISVEIMSSTKERRIKFLSVKRSYATAFNEQLMILENEVMQHTCHAGHVFVETVLPIIDRNLLNGIGSNFDLLVVQLDNPYLFLIQLININNKIPTPCHMNSPGSVGKIGTAIDSTWIIISRANVMFQ